VLTCAAYTALLRITTAPPEDDQEEDDKAEPAGPVPGNMIIIFEGYIYLLHCIYAKNIMKPWGPKTNSACHY
jgi:hypothetical protein